VTTTATPKYRLFCPPSRGRSYAFYRMLPGKLRFHFDADFNGYLLSLHADVAAAYRNRYSAPELTRSSRARFACASR